MKDTGVVAACFLVALLLRCREYCGAGGGGGEMGVPRNAIYEQVD